MPHCIFYNLLNLEIIPMSNLNTSLLWFLDLKSVNDFFSNFFLKKYVSLKEKSDMAVFKKCVTVQVSKADRK